MKGDRTMSRVIIRSLGLAALLALAVTSAWAGSDERKGTSGATELLIPVGARGSALGTAVSSDIVGAEAIFWNPAGIAGQEGTEVLFSHTSYIADMKVNYVALTAPGGALGTLGFNVKVLSIGDVIVTTEAAPDGTGEIVEPTFTVLGVSWGKAFTDRVRFGSTVNFVNERILDMNANGMAIDFGVQYDTGWKGLRLGMVMKNFGNSMSFNGSGLDVNTQPPGSDPSSANRSLRFSTASFEMPSNFTLSATYNAWQNGPSRLQLLGAFQNNNFGGDNFNGGAEWVYKNQFMLRGSWWGTMTSTRDLATGDDSMEFDSGDDVYSGYAFGAGANMKAGSTHLAVDFTLRPVRDFFDDTFEMGLRFKF
jgi:hypothetical protein